MTAVRLFVAAVLVGLGLAGPALAISDPAEMLPNPAEETRAESVGRQLRCLVCQNESIEDSNADLAKDLRRLVRQRIFGGGYGRAGDGLGCGAVWGFCAVAATGERGDCAAVGVAVHCGGGWGDGGAAGATAAGCWAGAAFGGGAGAAGRTHSIVGLS